MKNNFYNCNIGNSQIGKENIICISKSISKKDWEEMELFFKDRSKTVEKEYYFLVKEAEDYIKQRDEKGLKKFIKKYAAEFTTGVFCNVASANIVEILKGFIK